MDTSVVIQLTCQAAESVLRFRSVSFTGRPVIDVQAFRAVIAREIEKLAQQNNNPAVVPLVQVVDFAGIGAAWAALNWNGVTHKENHVSTEWFRNCVCNLVGGIVTGIAMQAFPDRIMNASVHLDLDIYNPFRAPGSASTAAPTQGPFPYVPAGANGNRGAGEARGEQVGIVDLSWSPGPSSRTPRQEVGELVFTDTYPVRCEVRKIPAASPAISEARMGLHNVVGSPGSLLEYSGGRLSVDSLNGRPAKRTRLPDSAPPRQSASQSPAGGNNVSIPVSERAPAPMGNNPSTLAGLRYRRNPIRWTEEETMILREARANGESWDAIHTLLPRHTRDACQAKYQTLIGNKARSNAARIARNGPRQNGRARNSSFQTDGAQEDEEDVEPGEKQEADGSTARARPSPAQRTGFKAINRDFADTQIGRGD